MKNRGMFSHALEMVKKNKRSYMMLSVTILMSFTFFLSYLVYTDSNIMTENVGDIYSEPYLIDINVTPNPEKLEVLVNKLKDIKDVHYYIYTSACEIKNYSGLGHGIYIFPREVWAMYSDLYNKIERVDGKEISLKKNEVLISEERYKKIRKKDKDGIIEKYIPLELENGNAKYVNVKVVGAYKSNITAKYGRGNWDAIIMSNETVEKLNYKRDNIHVMVYTKQPNTVLEETKNMDFISTSTQANKEIAFKEIRSSIKNKTLIAITLFVLLGINLFSSFKNALSDRKFEIGVKRALGADAKKIILQFLYEGIIVVSLNVFLSTLVTITGFSIYKLYLSRVKNIMYILNISRHSLIIFGIVSLFLTLFFSLMFAIQSAHVEIIKYLKGE